jgi:hypothetical protein
VSLDDKAVDHSDEINFKHAIADVAGRSAMSALGKPSFLPHSQLKHYLNEDCLLFRVDI